MLLFSETRMMRHQVALCTLLLMPLTTYTEAAFISALSRCPIPCQFSGTNTDAWSYYHSLDILTSCNQTVLFEANLNNKFNNPKSHNTLRACTAQDASIKAPEYVSIQNRGEEPFGAEGPQYALEAVSLGSQDQGVDAASASAAVNQLISYIKGNTTATAALFSSQSGVVAGFYIGPGIQADTTVRAMAAFANVHASDGRRAVQYCGSVNGTANRQTFGIILDTKGDLSVVQAVLSAWANGECQTVSSVPNWWPDGSPGVSAVPGTSTSANGVAVSNSSNTAQRTIVKNGRLHGRNTCNYVQVQSGEGCWSIAQRCSITVDQLESYNGGANFCNTIQVNQYVCCSSGSLPDFSPQPTGGNCYVYAVQSGDTCATIAKAHQMDAQGIVVNNNLTWGWMGCNDLQIGRKICLSTGNPPFPVVVPNAVCGPQLNNTTPTADPKTWSALNPCPLNACCNIWGQCGITSDFCTPDPADTGAPGTAQPGSNGCISHCGTDMVFSAAPDSFSRVGYFEAWNTQRPCLHMWPVSIPSFYTHVHFAFANISSSYDVDLGSAQDMFNQFKAKTGFKHILSFGGWAFSTSPETFPIFRQGVTSAQRQTFATNVANFIMDNGLDGVDFDWEYPGAPDIPGIPAGSPNDGANYLEFLQMLRKALPPQFSISIAAPASFWYLRGFPIAEISAVVDYIIYMTYDLHGQWDFNNKFSDPGCPGGNCLRSQVNRTETLQAFSMITKAGVPANKIMVGMALYGRSFQMALPGCYTEMYSGATPGECTDTAGYISNWEIQQILETPGNNAHSYFSSDAGDILVYNQTQWVSYLSQETYNSRMAWIQSLGLAGTSDWAMDLETSYYGNGTEENTGSGVVYVAPSVLRDPNATIACQPPCTFVLPPWILSTSTTITPQPVTETILEMYTSTQIVGGVTSQVYVSVTRIETITLAPIITDTIYVSNVEWADVSESVIYFTSSLIPSPVILTEPPKVQTTSSQTTTLAGVIWTFSPGPYPTPNPGRATGPPGPPGPPPHFLPSIHVTIGKPQPTCVPGSLGCGTKCVFLCGIEIPCLGICGCIGLGCPAGGTCVGSGCGANPNDNKPQESCSTTYTVTDCEVECSITDYGTTATTTCDLTTCVTVEACQATGSTTTSKTTKFACPWTSAIASSIWVPNDPYGPPPVLGGGGAAGFTYVTGANAPTPGPPQSTKLVNCAYHGEDPDNGVNTDFCVCSGSTFSPTTNSLDVGNACAYTKMPRTTVSVSTLKETVTSNCQVCTFEGENEQCTQESGCTPTTTTSTTTSTSTSTVVATPVAYCEIWTDLAWYDVAIYNIQHWATDGGASLHHQEKGCGAVTGWEWAAATKDDWPGVSFTLPFFIKSGCVERAIASAGGPKIQCRDMGLIYKRQKKREDQTAPPIIEISAEQASEDAARSRSSALQTTGRRPPPQSLAPTYTYEMTLASRPTYTPMTWPASEPPITVVELIQVPVTLTITTVPKPVNPWYTSLPRKTA